MATDLSTIKDQLSSLASKQSVSGLQNKVQDLQASVHTSSQVVLRLTTYMKVAEKLVLTMATSLKSLERKGSESVAMFHSLVASVSRSQKLIENKLVNLEKDK